MLKIKRKTALFIIQLLVKLFGFKLPPVPASSVIIYDVNKVLVVKLSYKNGYALPGGGLIAMETFEQAAKREVQEETGLIVTKLEYFNTYLANDEYPSINRTFVGKVIGALKSSDEGVPLWVDPKKILNELEYTDNRQAVKDFLKKNRI